MLRSADGRYGIDSMVYVLALTVFTVTILNLKRIVNAAWELEDLDTAKLSRYMRCLFQYALPHGNNVTENLLDQIYKLAQEASEVSGQIKFYSIILIFAE
jgi:hypothetical protein